MHEILEQFGNIPVTMGAIASLFPGIRSPRHKVRSLEKDGEIIRLKKGLYVVSPRVSRVALSEALIANRLYAPSYVSMHWALRYYGLIPEAVYLVQSMTLKHARTFETPIARFDYTTISEEAFPIGVKIVKEKTFAYWIATPEKALCDLIANALGVRLRYKVETAEFLFEDLRMDEEDFYNMDASIFERYIAVGKKASSIKSVLELLKNGQ